MRMIDPGVEWSTVKVPHPDIHIVYLLAVTHTTKDIFVGQTADSARCFQLHLPLCAVSQN